ncbi:MAG: hypothetical protein HC930_14230 [Hydrococcus sp. SU_1_0]|nr:hypothetical protein [Hydrococcus sp. SU_1_0]
MTLNQEFNLPYIPDLVALKVSGAEKVRIPNLNLEFHQQECPKGLAPYVASDRLREQLALSAQNSHLPDLATAKPALNDLLVRIRLARSCVLKDTASHIAGVPPVVLKDTPSDKQTS